MPLPAYLNNAVDQQILSELQAANQKNIDPLDFDHTEEGEVYVYNIGPNMHQVGQGGLGTFTVLACPPERAYSLPLRIWKKFPEGKNDDINKMSLRINDGYAIAESVVGYGKFVGSNAESIFSPDLRNFGVFTCGAMVTLEIGEGREKRRETILASERIDFLKRARIDRIKAVVINTREATAAAIKAARKNGDRRAEAQIAEDIVNAILPSELELDEAQERMNKFCLRLVEVANAFYRENKLSEINQLMRWAANVTGNTGLPWVVGSILMGKCDYCGNALPPDVVICLGCKNVVGGKESVVVEKRLFGYETYWDPTHPAYIGHKYGGVAAKKKEAAGS
jgi:hypothetical protein